MISGDPPVSASQHCGYSPMMPWARTLPKWWGRDLVPLLEQVSHLHSPSYMLALCSSIYEFLASLIWLFYFSSGKVYGHRGFFLIYTDYWDTENQICRLSLLLSGDHWLVVTREIDFQWGISKHEDIMYVFHKTVHSVKECSFYLHWRRKVSKVGLGSPNSLCRVHCMSVCGCIYSETSLLANLCFNFYKPKISQSWRWNETSCLSSCSRKIWLKVDISLHNQHLIFPH